MGPRDEKNNRGDRALENVPAAKLPGRFLLTGFGVGRFGPDAPLGLFEVPDDPPQRHAVMREDRVLLAGPVLAAEEHRLMKAGELVDDILEFHMALLEK